jgi:glycosyltransferase involved in cell wall biosynthesis
VWQEPWGTVVIEAMAMGKPVIASRIGGLQNLVVDDETGILVTPGDAGSLRAAMERLIGDKQTRERMGRASARRAPLFHVSAVVPRIEHIYHNVLRSTSRTSQGTQPVA